VQARSGWAVGWDKPEFWGRAALVAERADGPRRTLWGIESRDRGIPRPHMVLRASEEPVGEVTSGTFSPTLKRGIGLALIDSSAAVSAGTELILDVRGRPSTVVVTKPPFVESHVR
jgi:aminomethyltransferase